MNIDVFLAAIVLPTLLLIEAYIIFVVGPERTVAAQKKRIETLRRQVRSLSDDLDAEKKDVQQLREQVTEVQAWFSHLGPELLKALHATDKAELASLASLLGMESPSMAAEAAIARQKSKALVDKFVSFCVRENSKEDSCTNLLAENLWLFMPDYLSCSPFYVNNSISTIAPVLFPEFPRDSAYWKFENFSKRPDGVGRFKRVDNKREVLLIIEAKRNSRKVTRYVMDEALNYAVNFRKLVPELNKWDIECFAIGGSIDEGVMRQAHHLVGAEGSIIVTPLTWLEIGERGRNLNPILSSLSQSPRIAWDQSVDPEDSEDDHPALRMTGTAR